MLTTPSRIVGQIGNQLWTTFFLFDKAVANPDSGNMQEYERMIDTDETVAAGIKFMIYSTLTKLDRYTNESNPKIEDFVNECFEGMQGTLVDACYDILSAIWAGYSGTEIVWKPDGGKIVVDYLATYHPRTVYFNLDRQTGRLAPDPITQWRWFDGSPVVIPRNKSIVFTHNMRFNNPYGESSLRSVRKNWILKDALLKMWMNALDKFGTPLVAALVPEGNLKDPDNPTKPDGTDNIISNIEYMSRVLGNLQNGTGLAMSAGTGDEKVDVKALAAGGSGMGDAFHDAYTTLNKMIFRGLLVPSLVFDEGQKAGSYALGQSHFDIYQTVLGNIFKKLTETLLEQLVRPLVDMNFGPQTDYGEFPERELDEVDKQVMSQVFLNMTNAGYMSPEVKEHMTYVQSTLGIPEKKIDTAAKRAAIAQDYGQYLRQPEETAGNPPKLQAI